MGRCRMSIGNCLSTVPSAFALQPLLYNTLLTSLLPKCKTNIKETLVRSKEARGKLSQHQALFHGNISL